MKKSNKINYIVANALRHSIQALESKLDKCKKLAEQYIESDYLDDKIAVYTQQKTEQIKLLEGIENFDVDLKDMNF